MNKTFPKILNLFTAGLGLWFSLRAENAVATVTNLFFDVNGTTAGSGITGGSTYSWESAFWATNSGGTFTVALWGEGNFPEFSAASDTTTLSYTVNAGSPHHIAGALQRTSTATVTLTGADLTIDTGQQGFFSSGFLVINNKLTGPGGVISQSGQLFLNGVNDYSAGTTPGAGLLNFNNASSFGTGNLLISVSGGALICEGSSAITVPNSWTVSVAATLNCVGNTAGITYSGNIALGANTLNLGSGGNVANIDIFSGVISGTGGFGRSPAQSPAGIIKLTGANTYTGKSSFQSGITFVSTLNSVTTPAQQTSSSLGKPSSAANGTLSIGGTTVAGTLLYNGAGETTDRVIDLAGTTGGATIDQSGTGLLKFTSANTAAGVGSKTLTLQGSTAGVGEVGGAIVNNPTTGSTVATAAFATSATTVTLASVDGITVGATISGTGIGAGTTISAINTGTRVVTISPAATGAGTAGETITVPGVVNLTSVTKSGTGTWTLSGANTYGGNTTVSVGTLAQGAANVIPSGAGKGTFAVSSGATFDLGGFDCSLNGFGTSAGTIDNTTGSGSYTLTIGNNNGAGTHSGPIKNTSGTMSVTKTGTGAIVLSSATSTYAGKTIVNGGTLTINNAETALGTPPASPVADQLTLNTGTTFALGSAANVTLSVNRGITLSGSVTINLTSKDLTIPGIIAGTGASLTKSGANALILSGANTFDGGVLLTGGTLTVNNDAALGSGTLTITPAGICTVAGKSGTTTLANPITINAGGGQVIDFFATSGNNLTLNGQISGTAGFRRGNGGGAGNLTLNGNNSTFSGTVTLQQGPLVLGHKNALGTGSLVVTTNGSVAISLSANTPLTGANAVANAVTLNATLPLTGTSDLELSGVISGASGTLTNSGPGKIILSGANTYGGGTIIGSGTTLVNNASGSGTGSGAVAVKTGATLGGGGDIAGTVTVNSGGTLSPGASIGTLTLDVPPVLNGTTKMEIDRNGGSPLADKLVVSSGTLTYGGALNIVNLGAPLHTSDTFTLFSATSSSYAGSFASITSPGAGLVWDTSRLTVDGTIKAVCDGTLAFSAGPNTNICSGSSVVLGAPLGATGGSGSYGFVWSPSTGLNDPMWQNPIASPTTTTTYTVTVTDSAGCTNTSSVIVGIDVAPTISGQPGNTTVCDGSAATLSVAAAGSALTYSWTKHSNGGWGSAWSASGSGSAFLGNSTDDDFGDPACNSFSSTFDINSPGGNALGMWGGFSGDEVATRTFNALAAGQAVSIDFDNGDVDGGREVGFSLETSGGADVLQFYFLGGQFNYKYWDTAGFEQDTGIPFQRTGVRVQFMLLSSTTYKLIVTQCGGSATTFLGSYSGTIAQLKLFNQNTSGGNDHNIYFNNFIVGGYTDNADNYSGGFAGQDKGDQPIVAGNGASSYTTPTLTTADSGAQYQVVVAGCSGTILSSLATVTVNPPASVDAGPDQTVCASSAAATLAGSFGGAASSAHWSGGAGSFNPDTNTVNAVYTPSAGEITAGTVTLTLTTDDPAGPCGPVSDSMVITINPAATVNAGVDQTVCASSPAVTLAGTFGGAASSVTWTGGAGSFNPNNTATNALYTPTAGEITAGTVTLTLTTDDPAGPCGSVNDSMVITINPVATVNAGPDQTVCADSPAATLAGSYGGGASSVTWSGGAGSFNPNNTTTNAIYTATAGEIAAGSVTLTLTTDDPSGPCGPANDSMVITFDKVTATNVTFVRNSGSSLKISKTNLVANASDSDAETITFTGAGTDGVNLITTNGVTLSVDADWIFYTNSVTPGVDDSFSYKVTDARGCVALGTVYIQVLAQDTGQGTAITISNGVATVSFAGIPGRSYQVQRSTNLVDWVTLVTTNAPTNGLFQVVDDFSDLGVPPADPPSSAYYQLRVP